MYTHTPSSQTTTTKSCEKLSGQLIPFLCGGSFSETWSWAKEIQLVSWSIQEEEEEVLWPVGLSAAISLDFNHMES